MRVIDPGHKYALKHLDGKGEEIVTHVKREGIGYPGNVGHYAGTNTQEVLRMEIDRIKYLNAQSGDVRNLKVIGLLRESIRLFEERAAERHGRLWCNPHCHIESTPVCDKCGHIGCEEPTR